MIRIASSAGNWLLAVMNGKYMLVVDCIGYERLKGTSEGYIQYLFII